MPDAARPMEPEVPAPPNAGGAARPVRLLVTSGDQASPEMPVAGLVDVFTRRPELDAVALVAGGRPVGLVTRRALLMKLGRNFGYELFARRPSSRIADPEPLLVEGETPLAEAVERAFARPPDRVYDDLIVIDGTGCFVGLLSARQLAVEQGLALSRSVMEHERSLERNRELEKLERTRAQFLAHATHELRSPVNAIVGLSEILGMASARDDLTAIRERLDLLHRTATGLRGTINDILDLSKIEAGRMELLREPIRPAELLADLAATTRLLVVGRPIDVVIDDRDAPAVVSLDGRRLRQVLLNLASNAAKFTDAGTIELGAAESSGGLRFWVRDSGCGIRPEDMDRLFTPFGQLEDARTKAHAGTGLGLVISRSLANLMGGSLAVESRHGEGSCFTLHLTGEPSPKEPQ